MKYLNKFSILALGCLAFSACSDIDDMLPESGRVTEDQLKETTEAIADRVNADLAGIYTFAGQYAAALGNMAYHCDFGMPSVAIAMDANAADMVSANSDYEWFTPAFDLSDRDPGYIVAAMRYATMYKQIKLSNDLIASIDENTEVPALRHTLAQARAIRAYAYLNMAPYYQFNYATSADKPCVPIVSEKTPDAANNPRATVREVYEFIMADLNYAVSALEDYERTSKVSVDQQVAYGLRARANLYMEQWAAAADDADNALAGYTPASREDVSMPSFYDLNEPNWIWGILIEKDKVASLLSWPSHLGSFSSKSYAAGTGVYKRINKLLYDKIPATDVRKGWWVDENCQSPNLEGCSWNGIMGNDIPGLQITDVKKAFEPYTNVKFGMKSGIGSNINDCDWCLMRAEEMILIKAEGLAMSGQTGPAQQLLTSFVQTYRDPAYTCSLSGQELQNEIWKQRRIELWGEGFAMADIMRLNKPIVRIHGNDAGNWPEAFAFNVEAGDPWLLLRFPTKESNANAGISSTENVGGTLPVAGQNPNLRDGVTD